MTDLDPLPRRGSDAPPDDTSGRSRAGTLLEERQTGRFTYLVKTDTWLWADEVFWIHGYTPGEIEPSTTRLLRSKHVDDQDRVMSLFREAMRTGAPFNIYYRIVGGDGVQRRVVVAGEGTFGPDDQLETLRGYYIDLTPDFQSETARAAHAMVTTSLTSRAVIEQAKGALMLAYALDADAAFAMLRWWSRNRNVTVREIAARLLRHASDGAAAQGNLRLVLDKLLDDITHTRPAPDRVAVTPQVGPATSLRVSGDR